MVFNTGAALLDAIVLAVVSREDEGTYGYRITQDVRRVIHLSESTLYPVLRRLRKMTVWQVHERQFGRKEKAVLQGDIQRDGQLNCPRSELKASTKKIIIFH